MDNSPFIGFLKFLPNLDFGIWGLIKLAVLLALFLYISFSVMIVRQVSLMGKALNGVFEAPLRFFSWLYLVATIAIFLLAIVLL